MRPTPEATRERQRKEDTRALERFKRDPEVLPQVQRNIDARERTWAKEDRDAEIADKVRDDLAEQDAYARARAQIRAEQNVASSAEFRQDRAD
jgi:hypothetical protein